MELLKELYFIHAPSGNEDGIQGFIRHKLFNMGIDFKIDIDNQTYNLSHDKPLIVAHTDQVATIPVSRIVETKKTIHGDKNLGADDKNGIWIALKLLEQNPDLNFIFSTCEEIGGNIQNLINNENMQHIPYCLVFDRKGSSDIIGYRNGYCSESFEKALSEIAYPYGYNPTVGVWSDCDSISQYLNCVNLSCGYYNAHTDKEYTVKKELFNALNLAYEIINSDLESKKFEIYQDNFSLWENSYSSAYYDDDFICPKCGEELIEFADGSGGLGGMYCMHCHYEILNQDIIY